MIDLSTLSNKTFDITLMDGRILNIRKPSNQLLQDTFKMIDIIKVNKEHEKIIGAIYSFLTRAFNRNLNSIKFTQLEIEEEIDIDTAMYLILEYFKFIEEVTQEINF